MSEVDEEEERSQQGIPFIKSSLNSNNNLRLGEGGGKDGSLFFDVFFFVNNFFVSSHGAFFFFPCKRNRLKT